MKGFMVKRTIEHLLEATIFAGTFNKGFASKINELSLEAIKIQESIQNPSCKVDPDPIDSEQIDQEIKDIING